MSQVLVIEDDPSTRFLLVALLEEAGHVVQQAPDGRFIETAAPLGTELIVTDLFMPGREGLETIRYLRGSNPTIPILAISVGYLHGHPVDFLKVASAVGADAVLRKPFNPDEFMAEVARLLQQKSGTGA